MLGLHSSDTSLQELFGKLCRNYSQSSNKNTCKVKSRLFEVLLHFSRPQNANNKITIGANLNEMDMLFTEIHSMTNLREFDRAVELRQLLVKLMDDNGHISDEFLQCLKFFLCLARWSSRTSTTVDGTWQIPRFDLQFPGVENFLPKHFSVYGDTRIYKANLCYTQYPSEIFETLSDATFKVPDTFNNKIFEAIPGFDECGNPLYKCQGKKEKQSKVEKGTNGLMGFVNQNSLNNVSLQLPVLTPYSAQNPMSFSMCSTLSSASSEEQNANDEGFIDAENVKVFQPTDHTDIWESVSKIQQKPTQTWDKKHNLTISQTPLSTSLTGSLIGQMVNQGIMKQLKRVDPHLDKQEDYCTATAQTIDDLIQDVVNLLLGIPSKTFFYNKQKQQFRLRTKLSLPLLNSEPLTQLLKDFLDCGSLYVKLESFAQPQLLGSYLTNGLVVECFKEGVHQYLQYYRGRILYAKETHSGTLLCLHQAVYRAYRQLRYLTDFCLGERPLLQRVGQESVLPKGLKLLTYLYQSALQEWGGENDFLLLFLLKSACSPYFRFLRDWVFEGTLNDPYNEFNIRVNEKCVTNENFRSLYWSHGYVLKEKMSLVPFLGEAVTQNALLCGKSLNLLRICDPKHSLLDCCQHRPNLTLSLNSVDLEKTFQESSRYYNSLNRLLFGRRQPEASSAAARRNRSSVLFKGNLVIGQKTAETGNSAPAKRSEPPTPVAEEPSENVLRKTAVVANLQKEIVAEEDVAKETDKFEVITKEVKLELQTRYTQLINEADYEKEKLSWRAKRLELHEKRSELIKSEILFPNKVMLNANICLTNDTNLNSSHEPNPTGISTSDSENDNVGLDSSIESKPNNVGRLSDNENGNFGDMNDNLPFVKDFVSVDNGNGDDALDNISLNKDISPVDTISQPMDLDSESLKSKHKESVDSVPEEELEEFEPADTAGLEGSNEDVFLTSDEKISGAAKQEDKAFDFESILSVSVPKVKPYQTDYSTLGSFPQDNLLVTLSMFGPSLDWDRDQEVDCLSVPLPVYFHRSFNPPLQAQACLVNKAVLHHFNHKLHLMDHLNILRNLFFFNDGEFGRTLSRLVYNKASSLSKFRDLTDPFVLRSIANTALSSCLSGESPLVENLCLGPKLDSTVEPTPGFGILMNLELKYKVDWPLDIVLSEECEVLYNHIFGFLMQINYVIWSLTDVWYRLKHYDQLLHLSAHWQFRQIQVFRHEMLHFCQSVYQFVCRQVLQLSWQELLTELQDKVEDLEQLLGAHRSYLQKACTRCLLGIGTEFSLQGSVDFAFQACLSFHRQLLLFPWQQGLPFTEESFSRLVGTYQDFKNHVKLLCRGLKFSSSGQKGSFVDLLLLLDTSNHYS